MAMCMPAPRSLKLSMAWHHEVTECLAVATPHSTTQLVQLAQAESLGIVDHDGVHVGHVNAALDDSGGDEHIVVVIGKVENDLLQFFAVHASVSHTHSGIRNMLVDHSHQLGQR